jgi:hypothetical protein
MVGSNTHWILPGEGQLGDYEVSDTAFGFLYEMGTEVSSNSSDEEKKNRIGLIHSISDIIMHTITQNHYQVTINLSPEKWGVSMEDRPKFMRLMADVIAEAVRNVEEQMDVRMGSSQELDQRQFTIIVYHDTEGRRDQFNEAYTTFSGVSPSGTEAEKGPKEDIRDTDATDRNGSQSTKQSPGLESPPDIARRDAQFSSTSPDRALVACQICGSRAQLQ